METDLAPIEIEAYRIYKNNFLPRIVDIGGSLRNTGAGVKIWRRNAKNKNRLENEFAVLVFWLS